MLRQWSSKWMVFIILIATIYISQFTSVKGEFNKPIGDKTLLAWVSPANLSQKGGSVLSLEKSGGVFDAIVLGELAAGKWMPGSDFFNRTNQEQGKWVKETVQAPETELAYPDRGEVSSRRGGVASTRRVIASVCTTVGAATRRAVISAR